MNNYEKSHVRFMKYLGQYFLKDELLTKGEELTALKLNSHTLKKYLMFIELASVNK